MMESSIVAIAMAQGSSVCPKGYILTVDFAGHGSCSFCGPGTYSVSPMGGNRIGHPSCLSCPPHAICNGGDDVILSIGAWIVSNGMLILIGCPDGHQLMNSNVGIFDQAIQECVACLPTQYCLNSNNSNFTCQSWTASVYVAISVSLPISQNQFGSSKQFDFISALASIASVKVEQVMLESVTQNRRSTHSSTEVNAKVAAHNVSSATDMLLKFSIQNLNAEMLASGLPAVLSVAAVVVTDQIPGGIPLVLLFSTVVVGFLVLASLTGAGYFVFRTLRRQAEHRAFLACFAGAVPGDLATQKHIPLDLRNEYVPEKVIGRGTFGCIVQAKRRTEDKSVAIKLVVPQKSIFDDKEIRQLKREWSVMDNFTFNHCEHAVQLTVTGGLNLQPKVCWFIMELLHGDNMETVLNYQPINDVDCISMTRNVLAALKVMHSDGIVHRDIKPANIMRCRADKSCADSEVSYMYKLIDFGTALGIDETLSTEAMMTLNTNRNIGAGTLAYMSPEMFKEPEKSKYPTDLWSLGVTMFEVVTGSLPFEAESDLLWSIAVAGDLSKKAPCVLDRLNEDRRSKFDNNLSKVISRALEKVAADRYQSADEMNEAAYGCLILKGEAFYSVFISYRVASEAPLAKLLFDELNHSKTAGGHRVTVYWDAFRLVKGEDWEEGFANGLLHSLCVFPLLSYGATAPLCPFPEGRDPDGLIRHGWELKPVKRTRLAGLDSDAEDNVLKELLIAVSLLERRDATDRTEEEVGMLQNIYPILVGRPEPKGRPDYPRMKSFFQVERGGGAYLKCSSPPTNKAATAILRDKGHLPTAALDACRTRSVEATLNSLTRLQGCQLWSHDPGLAEVSLTKEQLDMVGTGSCAPGVDLDGVPLTEEQRQLCGNGLDERQLRMLKAQVRVKIADFHEIIDRSVASHLYPDKARNGRRASIVWGNLAAADEVPISSQFVYANTSGAPMTRFV